MTTTPTLTRVSRLGFVNAYLVGRGRRPHADRHHHRQGRGEGDPGRRPSGWARPIVRIALTHAHGDHVGGLDQLAAAAARRRGADLGPRRPPAREGHDTRPGEPADAKMRGGYPGTATRPSGLLEPGQRVGSLEVIAAPGHSPGHVAFLDHRDRTLIAGDAFKSLGGVATSASRSWRFPLVHMATWHRPTALESARGPAGARAEPAGGRPRPRGRVRRLRRWTPPSPAERRDEPARPHPRFRDRRRLRDRRCRRPGGGDGGAGGRRAGRAQPVHLQPRGRPGRPSRRHRRGRARRTSTTASATPPSAAPARDALLAVARAYRALRAASIPAATRPCSGRPATIPCSGSGPAAVVELLARLLEPWQLSERRHHPRHPRAAKRDARLRRSGADRRLRHRPAAGRVVRPDGGRPGGRVRQRA